MTGKEQTRAHTRATRQRRPADQFARRLLAWYDRRGRHHLPWQREPTPYRVWVSEVMLQQTQVAAVIPYYERFMRRFPDVRVLAAAPLDEILHLWSGLGYYARARNLQRAAHAVVEEHGGTFPRGIDAMAALPGVGRSTAGAVLALAHGERHPILDGNVKRVLARYHAVEGWPGQTRVARALWQHAARHTPHTRVAAYTQAIMDLGATVCLRAHPLCAACPLAAGCRACIDGRVDELPGRKPRRANPRRETVFLLLRDARGCFLLERRPPAGIWGGLWGFPEADAATDPAAACRERYGLDARKVQQLAVLHHGFTHFDLDIAPVLVDVAPGAGGALEGPATVWYNPASPAALGLAAPVAQLLADLTER